MFGKTVMLWDDAVEMHRAMLQFREKHPDLVTSKQPDCPSPWLHWGGVGSEIKYALWKVTLKFTQILKGDKLIRKTTIVDGSWGISTESIETIDDLKFLLKNEISHLVLKQAK